MKCFCVLVMIVLALLSPFCLKASDAVTREDLEEARRLVYEYYPVFNKGKWELIDKNGQILDSNSFQFSTIYNNQQARQAYAPLFYIAEKEGNWFLPVNAESIKLLPVPRGYRLLNIIDPGHYVLWSREGRDQLYHVSTNTFLTPPNNGEVRYVGHFVNANPGIIDALKNPDHLHEAYLYDLQEKKLTRLPSFENSTHRLYYGVETNKIFQIVTLLRGETYFEPLKRVRTSLVNAEMKTIYEMPLGWKLSTHEAAGGLTQFHSFSSGDSQNAVADSNGKILFHTKSGDFFSLSYCEGLFRGNSHVKGGEVFLKQDGTPAFSGSFRYATDFKDGRAFVIKNNYEEDKCYEIDTEGKVVRELPLLTYLLPPLHLGIIVRKNFDRQGGGEIYNLDGELIWETQDKKEFEQVEFFYRGFR